MIPAESNRKSQASPPMTHPDLPNLKPHLQSAKGVLIEADAMHRGSRLVGACQLGMKFYQILRAKRAGLEQTA